MTLVNNKVPINRLCYRFKLLASKSQGPTYCLCSLCYPKIDVQRKEHEVQDGEDPFIPFHSFWPVDLQVPCEFIIKTEWPSATMVWGLVLKTVYLPRVHKEPSAMGHKTPINMGSVRNLLADVHIFQINTLLFPLGSIRLN